MTLADRDTFVENHRYGRGGVRELGQMSRPVLIAVFVVVTLLALNSTALATYSDALPAEAPAGAVTTGWLQTVGRGHNGYLDLLVQVGPPGLMLILLATVTWPLFNVLRAEPVPLQRLSLPASIVIFCLGSNATESGLFNRDVVWSFFLVFGLSLLANLTTRAHASRSRHYRRSSRSSEGSGRTARTHGA